MKLNDVNKNVKSVDEISTVVESVTNIEADDSEINTALKYIGITPGHPQYKSMTADLKALKKTNPAAYERAISLD